MNSGGRDVGFGERIKAYVRNKWKDLLLIFVLFLILLFAIMRVFQKEETQLVTQERTQSEIKISRLLEEIDGVGDVELIVCDTEEGVESVVVVCDGAKNLQVVMNIREAVSAALGIQEKLVKIYLKKG